MHSQTPRKKDFLPPQGDGIIDTPMIRVWITDTHILKGGRPDPQKARAPVSKETAEPSEGTDISILRKTDRTPLPPAWGQGQTPEGDHELSEEVSDCP